MRKTAAVTTALALMATPAFAAAPQEGQTRDQSTAPGQICKNESRKKTMRGKGKSPFAACVTGAKKANREVAAEQSTENLRAPGQICKDESRKKSATDKKSPFAACVKGAAQAQERHEANHS